MFRVSEQERREMEARDKKDEVAFWSRLYYRGSGCFGIGRRAPEIKKELDRARRASKKH